MGSQPRGISWYYSNDVVVLGLTDGYPLARADDADSDDWMRSNAADCSWKTSIFPWQSEWQNVTAPSDSSSSASAAR